MLTFAADRNMINSSRYLPCFVDPFRFALKTEAYYSSSVSFIPTLQSAKKLASTRRAGNCVLLKKLGS